MPFFTKSPKTPLRNSYAQVTVAVELPYLKVPACQGSLAVDPDSESKKEKNKFRIKINLK